MDYKGIHEHIAQNDLDFRAGWSARHEIGTGLWFAAGLLIGLVLGVVL